MKPHALDSTVEDQEVSLVDAITNILIKNNHPNPQAWTARLDRNIYVEKEIALQRSLINRCWRLILGDIRGDTFDERYCLMDDGTTQEWLRVFEQGVVPCIWRHRLFMPAQSLAETENQ